MASCVVHEGVREVGGRRLLGPGAVGRDGFGYTVFGKVVSGQEVVDKIKAVVVDDVKGQQNVPVVPIVIQSASVVKR